MSADGHNTADKQGSAHRVRRTVILVILTVAAVFIAVLVMDYKLNYESDIDITASTVVREPLPDGCVNETGYYTDNLGMLFYESELLPGLEKFYKMTGVQPYVYITGHTDGMRSLPNQTEKREFAESKYQELFTDEGHLLLVVFKNDKYNSRYISWYAAGQKAASVIDKEAGEILIDYLNKYYDDQSLTYEQYFSKVFDLTAERIMSVTACPLLFIVLYAMLGALATAGIVFIVSRRVKMKNEEEAKRTEELLKTPLKKFSDKEDKAEILTRNYDDDPDNDVEL